MPARAHGTIRGGRPARVTAPAPAAVIEIGTTSIRMAVAQIHPYGRYALLDQLQMAVALGKDTFTRGRIEPETTEECVKALRSFRRILAEHGIGDGERVTAVATSAVREAANREAFLDRLYIATGINVRVVDQAEVNRFTYLAVRPSLEVEPFWKRSETLVLEVGGGSTEALTFRRGRIGASRMYRLGSLRLRQMLDDFHVPTGRFQEVLLGHVDQTAAQIAETFSPARRPVLVALGADARFACARLVPDWDRKGLARVSVAALSKLTGEILRQSADDLVRRHRLTYPDAETLGPALLVYARLARRLKLRQVLVSDASLRNGMLAEIATGGALTEDFKRQIVASAAALGLRYAVDAGHAQYVAGLCRRLFRLLQHEHGLGPRCELILTIAALLHEAGVYVSRASHHKHSLYLILHSGLFGLGSDDILLTALVARYHRRAAPQPAHEFYATLDRDSRIKVQKMAAILRVADALDSGHAQRLRNLAFAVEADRLVITASHAGSLALEQHRLQDKGAMFARVYGLRVVLQGGPEAA
jgi:exopolyphosphatase/guanosine-5'-triphosphate,3'-diphosphate pyrophosphatase